MPSLLQKILSPPVNWIEHKISSRPDKNRIFKALSDLYAHILKYPGKKGLLINFFANDRFIIFSDQHKGAKNGADDFAMAEKNYLAALEFYNENNFCYINLGDCEELWENTIAAVKKNNMPSFNKEILFLQRNSFIKIFGNHDLYWANDALAFINLESIYHQKISIYEGVILRTIFNGATLDIFLTHGHQGDRQSDGNWFSKWFIANVWAPLQAYLKMNPNTPAYNEQLKTKHNSLMYEWSSNQNQILLITGHTHQPVFKSLTYIERLYRQLHTAKNKNDTAAIKDIENKITVKLIQGENMPDFSAIKPTYFNSGCCCFNDGDITGIEIQNGCIRLIKWKYINNLPAREVLEETNLNELVDELRR